MSRNGQIYCFRAEVMRSSQFAEMEMPDWLEVRANWQGYRIATLPWIADVARAIGLLSFEDTPDAWRGYLETLGLQDVRQISCEEYYEETLYW
ncbi:MAG: hypothetical protein J7641_14235 [Cyanobacteria bacterium SID2]|nr:hypothetical protein [Cyanobacteria bacterium SID2]MBP0002915.1 hypothetical protein [Cyanobacteria bacterium SBC]